MKTIYLPILLLLPSIYLCRDINEYFERINDETIKFNHLAADIAWVSSIYPNNPELPKKSTIYQKKRILWQEKTCSELKRLQNDKLLNETQRRQAYLLCRGPKFTYLEARKISSLYQELQSIYVDVKFCIPTKFSTKNATFTDIEENIFNFLKSVKELLKLDWNTAIVYAVQIAANTEDGFCLKGEKEVGQLMKYSRNEKVLRWLWLVWREDIGLKMKEPYRKLVDVENSAARRNGYSDIGAAWREELETYNLRHLCRQLYNSIRPLFSMLHGVVRFYLRRFYGDIVPERGPIPAHLLGNLWSQNWEGIADLIVPETIDLDESIRKLNWTVQHMVKRAEDYYQSLSLPAMTNTFWRESIFARQNDDMRCHGTAADMFKHGDFRLLYCSGKSFEDFYVLLHEMGHIQYYMAYENQPGLFRQGANTAFHEAIGDAIMYGVLTPQHLHRLGLINDSLLFSNKPTEDKNYSFYMKDNVNLESKFKNKLEENAANEKNKILDLTVDDMILLKQALNKLPQIPFSLAIDEYRWKYFEGNIGEDEINEEFWRLTLELQGIAPSSRRGEEYFDVGAKFHIPDNTPYIRYFLSSFLQHQIFESLCKTAVYGRRDVRDPLPESITMNRCDIYGSKAAGKLLKDLMSRGSSQHWKKILQETIGENDISAEALERYYRPLYKLLQRVINAYRIPIGWQRTNEKFGF